MSRLLAVRVVPVALGLVLAALVGGGRGSADDDAPRLYIEPYLQRVSPEGVTVLFWTEPGVPPGRVDHGEDLARSTAAAATFVPSVGKTLHTARISGYEPGEEVPYRAVAGDASSAEHSFRTAPAEDRGFRLAVLGDGRTDDDVVIGRHRRITELAWSREPDLALHVGDMVETGDQVHWDRFFRRIATASDPGDPGLPFASRVPYYLVVGNHEIYASDGEGSQGFGRGNLETAMARFQAYVDVPPNGSASPIWRERYYAFDYGPATFIVLDANNTSDDALDNHDHLDDGTTPDWEPGSEQHRWLVAQLERARRRSALTFVAMHPAPYCRGSHGDPEQSQSGYHIRALDPLFRAQGVDAVLSGHDHLVERCLTGPEGFEAARDDGAPESLNYFVVGNSGHSSRRAGSGWQRWLSVGGDGRPPYYSRYFYDWAETEHTSFLEVDVEPLPAGRVRATFRVVRDDGRTFDELVLERRSPAG